MACPYFQPEERLLDHGESGSFGLGDPYLGRCGAVSGDRWRPSRETVLSMCNCGDVMERCVRFPADSEVSSTRFFVGAFGAGHITIRYTLFQDQLPAGHGTIDFHDFSPRPVESTLQMQAWAFAQSARRRIVVESHEAKAART